MEEIKGASELENDSIASSEDLSSDESLQDDDSTTNLGSSDDSEWNLGCDLYDQDFPECCKRYFTPTNKIEKITESEINTPFKSFLKIFSNSILNMIVSESNKYFNQQFAKGVIAKSENPGSTYYLFCENRLKIPDILGQLSL